MDAFILQEHPVQTRVRYLIDSSEGVEEKTFIRAMDEAELTAQRISLQETVDTICRVEDEAKMIKKQYSDQLKELNKQKREILRNLKQGGVEVTEATYKLVERDENAVGYYSKTGQLIYQRPIMPEEKQIAMRLNAANE